MKQIFLGHTYLEQQLNEEALLIYQKLSETGFSKSSYIMAQIAVAYHNLRGEALIYNKFIVIWVTIW